MSHIPEIECPDCEGWGELSTYGPICPACKGEGWRPMNSGEIEAAAERQVEERQYRAEMTLDEQHLRAWNEKHGRTV